MAVSTWRRRSRRSTGSWRRPSISQKELIFLTDLQAASWRTPSQKTEGFKRVLARIEARQPRSVLIDLGKSGGENRAVIDLSLDAPGRDRRADVLVRAVIRNFGGGEAQGVPRD